MNDGVAMLLERMKTNPEEFVDDMQHGESKWGRLMTEYRGYLPKEDLVAFDAGHKEAIFQHMQQRFTEAVMEELIEPKSKGGVTLSPYAIGTGTTLWGAGTKAGTATFNTPIAGVTQTV